jgi:hypothetical protein
MSLSGLPHSEILGSKPVCGLPKLIAAYHVLHRLLAPRHSPYALSSLTIKNFELTLTAARCSQSAARTHVRAASRERRAARCDSPLQHCYVLWSEKTTVCRIFSCKRTGVTSSCGPTFVTATSYSTIRAPAAQARPRSTWWRIPGSNR